jgi:hypothetical protein
MRVLLVHGWGYGPGIWGEMIRYLPPSWHCEAMENWDFLGMRPEDYDLWIGHSYGFFSGYQALPHARWIAINSAPCFVASPQNPGGIPLRVLQAMARGFEKNPTQVLRDFQERAGGPYPCITPQNILQDALKAMQKEVSQGFTHNPRHCERSEAILKCSEPKDWIATPPAEARNDVVDKSNSPPPIFCALTSANDPIITYPWASHAQTVAIHPGHSHLLPLTHPAWCAETILEVLA